MASIMGQGVMLTEASAPTTLDYGESDNGLWQNKLPFTLLMAFCEQKYLSIINPLS